MIWLKRDFYAAEFAASQDVLEKLMMATPNRYAEFLMFSTAGASALDSTYFVGLPDASFASAFPGFEPVAVNDLPHEIDTFLVGDQTKEPFLSRFKFRGR